MDGGVYEVGDSKGPGDLGDMCNLARVRESGPGDVQDLMQVSCCSLRATVAVIAYHSRISRPVMVLYLRNGRSLGQRRKSQSKIVKRLKSGDTLSSPDHRLITVHCS